MNTKVRIWHLITIAVGVVACSWLLQSSAPPATPDFTSQGFTSVSVELQGLGKSDKILSVDSDNPALVTELAAVLQSGRGAIHCRCAELGSLVFRRPDGTTGRIFLMPAHDDASVEFRTKKGRYQVSRVRFLKAVESLGVPASRWYRFPDYETPSVPTDKKENEPTLSGKTAITDTEFSKRKMGSIPFLTTGILRIFPVPVEARGLLLHLYSVAHVGAP